MATDDVISTVLVVGLLAANVLLIIWAITWVAKEVLNKESP